MKTKRVFFNTADTAKNCIKIVCNTCVAFTATIHMGHPANISIIDCAMRVKTGSNAGKPEGSIIKSRVGVITSFVRAIYYQEQGVNILELEHSTSAYSGIIVELNYLRAAGNAASDFVVTKTSGLSRETGDVNITIADMD